MSTLFSSMVVISTCGLTSRCVVSTGVVSAVGYFNADIASHNILQRSVRLVAAIWLSGIELVCLVLYRNCEIGLWVKLIHPITCCFLALSFIYIESLS